MEGNNLIRVFRLLNYFLMNLNRIPVYFRWSISNKTPLEIELPWIAYDAIEYLEKFIKPHHEVAEFGGGGSTIFFAKRATSVFTIESDINWAGKISTKLLEKKINNVALKVHPFDANDPVKFKDSDFLKAIGNKMYDIILIDSYDINHNLRFECFYHAENHIKKNGCIVVDDSFRYAELRNKNCAKSWREFRSIGPCRKGVTTTDIYFY